MSKKTLKEDTQPFTPLNLDTPYPQPRVRRTGEYDPIEPPRSVSPRQENGGCGCWLPALLTAFIVTLLIGVGLFLPPVDLYNRLFGAQYAMLDAQNNAVATSDGLTLVIDPADTGDGFGVALASVPMESFVAGSANNGAWMAEAQAAAPPYLSLQSPVYSIATTGSEPGAVTLSVNLPPNAGNRDILDLYSWNTDARSWEFVPSHSDGNGSLITTVADVPDNLALFQAQPPEGPTVLVSVDIAHSLTPEVAQLATIVAPAGLQPTLEGTLTGSLAPGFELNAGYYVMPSIRNFSDPRALDPATVEAILASSTLRGEHVANIRALATGGYSGVFIDYRDLSPEQRANFTAFVRDLSSSLHEVGLLLGVTVPAAQNVAGTWDTGAYDWRAIGQYADFLQVTLNNDPASFAPGQDRIVEAMMRWAVGEVSRYKLLMGLSALSVRQANTGDFTSVGYDEALSALGDVSVQVQTTEAGTIPPGSEIAAELDGFDAASGYDETLQAPYVDYMGTDGATVACMWLTTADALGLRMDRTVPFALDGLAFDDLLANGVADGVLETIFNYKLQLPGIPSRGQLALRWRIEGVNGVVDEITTDLNQRLVATITAPDGNYAINVAVVSNADGETSAESVRSGAAVAVFAPTATPTPIPTDTPTPTPEPTSTPVPVVVAAAPVSAPSGGGAPAPSAPGSGSIVGGFEYGGHVTDPASGRAANAMRSAGMSWMKIQFRYSPGMDPGAVAGQINSAHAAGFKILVGLVGYPNDLAAGGAGYVQGYANFAGGVAALGPEAIEVWNEMNIDREWPTGQISGAAYADMLRQTYNAIKSRNGAVMVISGAPAPTGAEGAFPGQVVNDDRFLREMVAAGAMQYMDCLGAHYNEGIVGPANYSGDPRDNYYTRYFPGMLDTYWNISGGQRPICFTELGYLTSSGYPPLPSYFGWAANVTIDQQAAWLAQAAALASQSGRVRLMIVWNVDFTNYGSDPMAGYAIIRADGGCPACGALASAR